MVCCSDVSLIVMNRKQRFDYKILIFVCGRPFVLLNDDSSAYINMSSIDELVMLLLIIMKNFLCFHFFEFWCIRHKC